MLCGALGCGQAYTLGRVDTDAQATASETSAGATAGDESAGADEAGSKVDTGGDDGTDPCKADLLEPNDNPTDATTYDVVGMGGFDASGLICEDDVDYFRLELPDEVNMMVSIDPGVADHGLVADVVDQDESAQLCVWDGLDPLKCVLVPGTYFLRIRYEVPTAGPPAVYTVKLTI